MIINVDLINQDIKESCQSLDRRLDEMYTCNEQIEENVYVSGQDPVFNLKSYLKNLNNNDSETLYVSEQDSVFNTKTHLINVEKINDINITGFELLDDSLVNYQESPMFNEESYLSNLLTENIENDAYNNGEKQVIFEQFVNKNDSQDDKIIFESILEKNDDISERIVFEQPPFDSNEMFDFGTNDDDNHLQQISLFDDSISIINVDEEISKMTDDIKVEYNVSTDIVNKNNEFNNQKIDLIDINQPVIAKQYSNNVVNYENNYSTFTKDSIYKNIDIIETTDFVNSPSYTNNVSLQQPEEIELFTQSNSPVKSRIADIDVKYNLVNNQNLDVEKIQKIQGSSVEEQFDKLKKPNLFRRYYIASAANLLILKSINRLINLQNKKIIN